MTDKERIIELIRNEFGLEDGVRFNIEGSFYNPFYFEKNKLFDKSGRRRAIVDLLSYGDIEVLEEPLLTDEEKEYLKTIIKYTDYKINTVTWSSVKIHFNCGTMLYDTLPDTTLNFKGLEVDKMYSLEELGLL